MPHANPSTKLHALADELHKLRDEAGSIDLAELVTRANELFAKALDAGFLKGGNFAEVCGMIERAKSAGYEALAFNYPNDPLMVAGLWLYEKHYFDHSRMLGFDVYRLLPALADFMDSSGGYDPEAALLAKLRQAIAAEGRTAKVERIIKAAHVQQKPGRDALRQLQERGEYDGYTRPRPGRYC